MLASQIFTVPSVPPVARRFPSGLQVRTKVDCCPPGWSAGLDGTSRSGNTIPSRASPADAAARTPATSPRRPIRPRARRSFSPPDSCPTNRPEVPRVRAPASPRKNIQVETARPATKAASHDHAGAKGQPVSPRPASETGRAALGGRAATGSLLQMPLNVLGQGRGGGIAPRCGLSPAPSSRASPNRRAIRSPTGARAASGAGRFR